MIHKPAGSKKWIAIACVLGGVLLFMYPYVSNYLYTNRADSIARMYRKDVRFYDDDYVREEIEGANNYNEKLYVDQVERTCYGNEALRVSFSEYDELLQFGTPAMAILEIPSIRLKLPVFRGSSDEVLKKGLGHLKGSSIPVGGINTHAVITGHTGMNTARLFSDLVNVSEGDLFFIEVADQTLAYKVIEINIVKPEETSLLEIVPGKDLVTLVTCTPYGVNTHRLLVKGERTAYHPEDKEKESKESGIGFQWSREYFKALAAGAGIAVAAGLLLLIRRKRRCKKP